MKNVGEPHIDFTRYIRNWPGVSRSDLTHILAQPHVFPALIEALASPFISDGVTKVATIDALGFALGGGVAHRLDAGLVAIRKAGAIAWDTESIRCVDYSGTEKTLEIARDAVAETDRILVVDDWSETGEQLWAAITLVERLGAHVVGAACMHIARAVQRDSRFTGYRLHGVIKYEDR
jgi:adenine phosphoribosyltransferase